MTSSQAIPPVDRRFSRRLMWLAIFVALLFGGYAVVWFVIADRVEQGIDAGLAKMRAEDGVSAACDRRQVSGFPFRLELHCDRVAFDDPRANLSFEAGALRGARQIYDPWRTIGEVDGPLTVAAPFDAELDWSLLRASVRDAQPLPDRVSIAANELKATARPNANPLLLFTASQVEGHMRTNGPDIDLAARFSDLTVDPAAVEGRTIPPLSGLFDATVAGGVALANARPVSLRGKSAQIRTLEIGSGTGKLVVSGPIAFDENGLANGKLEVAFENPAAVSQAFQTAIPEQANNIRTGFSALLILGSRPSMPLMLEQGEARMGFIKLGRLPPVE